MRWRRAPRAALGAELWIVFPDLRAEPRPVALSQPDERALLVVLIDRDDIRRRALLFLDPTESLADRGRERAIGANLDLVSESYVRHEHGEKLDRCDELVIASQSRVKLAAQ